MKQGDLGTDGCSFGSITSARRPCSQLLLLLLMWSWSTFLPDRRIWVLSWCSLSYTPASLLPAPLQDSGDGRLGVASHFQRCSDFSFKHWVEKLQEKKYLILKYLDYEVQPVRYRNCYVQKYSLKDTRFLLTQKNFLKIVHILIVTT